MKRSGAGLLYGLSAVILAALFAAGFSEYYALLLRGGETASGPARIGLYLAAAGLAVLAAQAVLVFTAFVARLSRQEERIRELSDTALRLSVTDELTRVYNRSKLEESLLREIEHTRRYRAKATALLLDIDGFHQINREHGDRAGDRVLIQLSRHIQQRIRKTDMLFRWRGGKFVILAPHIGEHQAAQFADKLLSSVEEAEFEHGIRVRLILGMARIEPTDTPDSFLVRLKAAAKAPKERPARPAIPDAEPQPDPA